MMRRNETLNEVIEKASGELRIIIEADQVPGGMPTCVFDGRVSEFKMTEEAESLENVGVLGSVLIEPPTGDEKCLLISVVPWDYDQASRTR